MSLLSRVHSKRTVFSEQNRDPDAGLLSKNETPKLLTEIFQGHMILYEAADALLYHQQEQRRILRLFTTSRFIRKGEQRMSTPRPDDKILLFPQTATNEWIEAYARAELSGKNEATIDAYLRILRQLTAWVAQLPGSEGQFHPKFLTKTAFGDYMEDLKEQEYSTGHQERVKTVVNAFANWLIGEGEMRTNPTRGKSGRAIRRPPWRSDVCFGLLGRVPRERCFLPADEVYPGGTEDRQTPYRA